jgi:hypothetical protein
MNGIPENVLRASAWRFRGTPQQFNVNSGVSYHRIDGLHCLMHAGTPPYVVKTLKDGQFDVDLIETGPFLVGHRPVPSCVISGVSGSWQPAFRVMPPHTASNMLPSWDAAIEFAIQALHADPP